MRWPYSTKWALWHPNHDEEKITGDMGNGGPQANSVLWLPDGYSSYRDERWCVRKLLMSTFQIWHQKKNFACGSPESRKGSDVTGRCGKCVYTTKECFVTLRVLLLVQRRAMVRWNAGDEYIPNLTSKTFFSIWITWKSGGGSDVTGDVGSLSTPGENVLWHWAFIARTETSDGALESW